MTRTGWCTLGLIGFIFILIITTAPVFHGPPRPDAVEAKRPKGEETRAEPKRDSFRIIPFTPAQAKPLIVYVENQLIPEKWLRQFHKKIRPEKIRIEQRLLSPPNSDKPLPLDGDLYAASPRTLVKLRAVMEFAPFKENELWQGVNPAFSGHAFDPDNRWTRPWRWTPYLFYIRNTAENPVNTRQWWKNKEAFWPRDFDLLTALQIKDRGLSANIARGDLWRKTKRYLQANLRTLEEKKCWQALQKTRLTFLPAALRLQAQTPIENLQWRAPPKGTLIRFHVLAIPAKSERAKLSRQLIQFLLSPKTQNLLVEKTGYFPVRSQEGKETAASPIPLPKGRWFRKSEFLQK